MSLKKVVSTRGVVSFSLFTFTFYLNLCLYPFLLYLGRVVNAPAPLGIPPTIPTSAAPRVASHAAETPPHPRKHSISYRRNLRNQLHLRQLIRYAYQLPHLVSFIVATETRHVAVQVYHIIVRL